MIEDLSDQRLIELALEGNQSAFKILYNRYVNELFRFISQFSPERMEIMDLVQQTFIKAFTKLNKFLIKSSFKTWLFSIAIRELQMNFRKWKDKEIENLDADDELSTTTFQFDMMSIRFYVEKLDERKRMVFLLSEVEGYSHKEIADLLNIQESYSRTLLTRAKTILKNYLIAEQS